MTVKKKVVSTTLAVSVAATLMAGLPIGGADSLAGKAGLVGVASAATSKETLQSKLSAIYYKLGTTGKTNVTNLYDALREVDNSEAAEPLIAKFSSVALSDVQKQALAELFAATGITLFLPPDLDSLTALLEDTNVAAAVDALEADAGIDITVEGLAQLSLDLFGAIKELVKNNTYKPADIADPDKRDALLTTLLGSPTVTGNATYSTLLTKYFGGQADELTSVLKAVYNNYKTAIDEGNTHYLRNASLSLAAAYYSVYFPSTPSPTPTDTNTDTTTTPTGPVTIDQALGAIADLKDKLANAAGDEKDKLIKDAVAKASSAIANAAKLDLTSLTQTDGNKTTVTVTASAIADVLKSIQSVQDALKDAIGSTDSLTLPPLTIDLGTSDSTEAKVSLASDVLAQVIAAGLGTVEIAQNGLSAAIPLHGELKRK